MSEGSDLVARRMLRIRWPIGLRVRLSVGGHEVLSGQGRRRREAGGEVVGYTDDSTGVRIRWVGLREVQAWNEEYLTQDLRAQR